MVVRKCIVCGKEFIAVGKKKTCSEECKTKDVREKARIRTHEHKVKIGKFVLQKKICPVCGKEFETYKPRQILCGKESCKEKNMENYRKENREKINNKRKIRYENNKEVEKLQNKIRYQKNKKVETTQSKIENKEKNKKVVIQTCVVCGKLILKKRVNQKTCGEKECRNTYKLFYVRKYKAYKRELNKHKRDL